MSERRAEPPREPDAQAGPAAGSGQAAQTGTTGQPETAGQLGTTGRPEATGPAGTSQLGPAGHTGAATQTAQPGPAGHTGPDEQPAKRGLFVTFEGGDGSGKTTQVGLLKQWLEARGHSVRTTREPGGTELGRQIRQLLLHGGDVAPRAEALLYAADRAHHVATLIGPALERGEVVIADRYIDSSVAYQGAARSLGKDEIRELSLWATGGLMPDVTVLLDLPVGEARARLGASPDRIESAGAAFHEAVRREFLELARMDPGRCFVVDARGEPEVIAEQIRQFVSARLGWR